jgi:hypothetical protein
MMKVLYPCVQAQKFLCTFPPPESKLLPFLTSWKTVRLLNDVVAACRRDQLLVVDVIQARDLSDRGSLAAELPRYG